MRIVEVLKRRTPGTVPVWMMRQAGRYLPEYRAIRADVPDFLSLCYTPELAAEVTLQPIRRFGFDAAILFSDILVIPDALGQKVAFVEGEGPRLEPVTNGQEVSTLKPGRVLEHLQPVFETVRRVRDALPAETALIGFCGAPWTVATYMVAGRGTPDQAPARLWAYRQPGEFQALIDLLVESSIDYLDGQVRAGADLLQIFDSWAGSLPEAELRRWSFDPLARIVNGVKARHPGVPVIVFPRGAEAAFAQAGDIGADGVSIGTSCPLHLARTLQGRMTVQGNLDPLALVAGGAALEAVIDRILDMLAGGPFIFNLGHGIVPETPVEHVARAVERVRGYNGG